MVCFATPYGLRYAAHCFNRADAQNNRPTLIPTGGKLGVTSKHIELGIYKISARFDPASFTTPIPEHCWYGYSAFQNSFRLIRT